MGLHEVARGFSPRSAALAQGAVGVRRWRHKAWHLVCFPLPLFALEEVGQGVGH